MCNIFKNDFHLKLLNIKRIWHLQREGFGYMKIFLSHGGGFTNIPIWVFYLLRSLHLWLHLNFLDLSKTENLFHWSKINYKKYLSVFSTFSLSLIYLGKLRARLYLKKKSSTISAYRRGSLRWMDFKWRDFIKMHASHFRSTTNKGKETLAKMVCFQQFCRYLLFLSIKSIGTLLFKLYSNCPIMSV